MSIKNRLEIVLGDITEIEADAIVNAANTDLKLGSGVAGAIRDKGGPTIQIECNKHSPLSLGEVAITGAGNLTAEYVIHAAGMHLGGSVNEISLKNSTWNSLVEATEYALQTIAFPAIGTGVGNFPTQQCANIMISTVVEFLDTQQTSIKKIYFVLFDDHAYNIFKTTSEIWT